MCCCEGTSVEREKAQMGRRRKKEFMRVITAKKDGMLLLFACCGYVRLISTVLLMTG